MKDYLKKMYSWLDLLFQTVASLFTVFIFNHGNRPNIKRIDGAKSCQTVSIIANGPSAGEVLNKDIQLLQTQETVVVNYFANTEYFFTLKPRYYVLLDPAYFIEGYGVGSEVSAGNEEITKSKMISNLNIVNWEMTIFIPFSSVAKKNIEYSLHNPKVKIAFYYATRISGFRSFQKFLYQHNQGLPSSKNVIIAAMILMLNIGYKQIYLYGAEFSWTKTMDIDIDNGMMYFNDKHYYSKSEIRYFGKGGYKWWLQSIVEMLDGTEKVAKYAESINAEIINRTKGSFIDAFKYEKID